MRTPPLATFISDPGALTEIHLQLRPRLNFHAPEGQLELLAQAPRIAPHRIITARKLSLERQILVNALNGQTRQQPRLDHFLPGLAQTLRSGPAQLQRAGLRVDG
jgi:hypothetical protein